VVHPLVHPLVEKHPRREVRKHRRAQRPLAVHRQVVRRHPRREVRKHPPPEVRRREAARTTVTRTNGVTPSRFVSATTCTCTCTCHVHVYVCALAQCGPPGGTRTTARALARIGAACATNHES